MERVERRISAGEVMLNVVTQGKGPPVLLLHGFPEFWYSWRHQMDALADAGYQAIAPDLRGYNLSDKPPHVAAYRIDRLEADLRGLMKSLELPRAHVVAHDWGGVLAWSFAAHQPELVQKLVILNAPHPTKIAKALVTNPRQLRRSWYMFAFQLPFIPERMTLDPNFMRRALRGMAVHKERFSDADIARFEAAYHQPGAASAALNWYRAAFRNFGQNVALPRITRPTLVIWGEKDAALGVELLDGLDQYAPDLRIHRIPDASHWVQQDTPEEVNRELLAFLGPARA